MTSASVSVDLKTVPPTSKYLKFAIGSGLGGGGAVAGVVACLAASGAFSPPAFTIPAGPAGAKLGYHIAVASGELDLALDGAIIARVDRPLADSSTWYVKDLPAGRHRLDITVRNLGNQAYNAECVIWVGDPAAPSWRTPFTYRSGGPADNQNGAKLLFDVGGTP